MIPSSALVLQVLHLYRDGELADTSVVHKPALFREFAESLVAETASPRCLPHTKLGTFVMRRGRARGWLP